jgi:predicted amidohydrolase YtcJ
MRAGVALPGADGLITLGPVKVFVDGSLNTRTALCHDPYPGGDHHGETVLDHAGLIAIMDTAAAYGLGMAVHAIGDRANTIALDCFQQTGLDGRIEHAQLLADADLPRFPRLGVVAGMQPWHAIDDWPVADHYWHGRTDRAFPFAALLRSGAVVEFGSDAPVAPLDPWRAIAAAVDRTTLIGHPWHPEQELTTEDAIACSTRSRGRLRIGDPADLVLLDADPVGLSGTDLITIGVHATAVAGRWLHGPADVRS